MKIPNAKYVLLIIFLYLYLYNPIFQIIDFGLIKILLLISIFYIIATKRIKLFITLFKNEIILSIILIVYSSLVVFWGDGTAFKVPYNHVVWFLECFTIPFFILFFFKDIFRNQSWESIVVTTGFIASLITLFLILNPKINFIIHDSVIRDTLINIKDPRTLYRGFAIAESSAYSYGIIQGLLLAICLISIKRNHLYAIPVIFLFISILFNARIGFICLIIGLSLMLLKRKVKILNTVIFLFIAFVGYILFFKSNFFIGNSASLKWGFNFFNDTVKFITGQETQVTNYTILFNRMFFSPEKFINLLFGEGRIVFYATKGSDVGYINEIFVGGLVYLILLLSFLFYMFVRNINNTTNKAFTALFFLTLLAVNIKGDALFVSNGFFRLISFYYIYCILLKRFDSNSLVV